MKIDKNRMNRSSHNRSKFCILFWIFAIFCISFIQLILAFILLFGGLFTLGPSPNAGGAGLAIALLAAAIPKFFIVIFAFNLTIGLVLVLIKKDLYKIYAGLIVLISELIIYINFRIYETMHDKNFQLLLCLLIGTLYIVVVSLGRRLSAQDKDLDVARNE